MYYAVLETIELVTTDLLQVEPGDIIPMTARVRIFNFMPWRANSENIVEYPCKHSK